MQISPRSVALLKQVAVPFDDTVDTVIERVVQFYVEHNGDVGPAREAPQPPPAGVILCNVDAAPDLRYTRVIQASVGDQELRDTNWNELVRRTIELAYKASAKDFGKLRLVTTANVVQGHKDDEGYTPLPIGLSVQGVAANDAFRIVRDIARKLRIPLTVTFQWRDKEGATHPGEAGRFVMEAGA